MPAYVVSIGAANVGYYTVWVGTDRQDALRFADHVRGGGGEAVNPSYHEYVAVAEWEGDKETVVAHWSWSYHFPAKTSKWFVSSYYPND